MLPRLGEIGMTLAARVIAMFGPFGVSIITARALGPDDRGRYFLIFSFAQIAAQIANLGLSSSNTYFGAGRHDLLGRLGVNSLYVAFVVAPLCALATVLVMDHPDLFGFPPPAGGRIGSLAYLAVPLAPLIVAFIFLSNLAVAIGRVRLFNALTIAYGLAGLAAAALVGLLAGGILSFLAAAVVAIGIVTLVAAVLLLRRAAVSWRFDTGLLRQGFAYSMKAYLSTMMGFLMTRVGVIALQQQADFGAVGQFSIALQFADALILLPATIGLLLFPSLVRTPAEKRWPAQWRAFWLLCGAMVAILAASALIVPWLVPLVFGPQYQEAVPLILALLPSVMILSAITMLSQYLAAQGYPWGQALAWVVGFVAQAILGFWLAGLYGAMGVVYAITLSGLIVFVLILVTAFRTNARSASMMASRKAGRANG